MNTQTLLRKAKEEKLRRLINAKCKDEPLFWLEHKMKETPSYFRWSDFDGYEEHNWDGDIDPIARVWNKIAEAGTNIRNGKEPEYRFFGVEAGTGTSKTFWLARLVLWFLDCYPNSLVVTSAPKQDQLRLNLWSEISRISNKFRKFRPNANLYSMRLVVDDGNFNSSDDNEVYTADSWHAIGYVSGVGSEEESAGRARGFHRENMLIILEEATSMSKAVMTAFQNTCTGQHNLIVAVGNPDSENDPLHTFIKQNNVFATRISSYDYPNVVLGKEVFAGGATRISIKAREETYGKTSELYNAMVRGICPKQNKNSLILAEWIENAFSEPLPMGEDVTGALGIDVANSDGGDKACTVFGRGNVVEHIKEFYCPNATHLAYNVLMDSFELASKGYTDYAIPTVNDYNVPASYIGVDSVGVGVSTVNAFIDLGFEVQSLQGGQWSEAVPTSPDGQALYSFSSLRSQMYWELREDLRKGNIILAIEDLTIRAVILKELTSPRFILGSQKITIEKKEDIKKRLGKSPNIADALVYWNWVRKGYRVSEDSYLPLSAGR